MPAPVRPLASATVVALAVACPHARPSRDCEGLSREQCAWKRATAQPQAAGAAADPSAPDIERGEEDGPWVRADGILRRLADRLASGSEGSAVSREARGWCAEIPTLLDKGHGASWVCHLREPPRLAGRDLTLEGSERGVVALGARDLSGQESKSLVDQAMARWRSWCVDAQFSALERAAAQEFHACTLPGGPLLVVGRFPQDPDADLWQVSLTIMGAG